MKKMTKCLRISRLISQRALWLILATVALNFSCKANAALIYVNDQDGNLYSYLYSGGALTLDKEYGYIGAYSISAGPTGNIIYFTDKSTDELKTFDLVSSEINTIGGEFEGNALGEGRDGNLYGGS